MLTLCNPGSFYNINTRGGVSHTPPKEIAITRPFSKQLAWNFFLGSHIQLPSTQKKFQVNCFENGRVIAISLGEMWDTKKSE